MWPREVVVRQLSTPVPALRNEQMLAYDLARLVPTHTDPHRIWIERTYLLVDLGVQFKRPHWWRDDEPETWYVDLVKIEEAASQIIVRDLYLDLVVPTDGRPYRLMDLDEFGDALATRELSTADAIDGLRRWHSFLEQHVRYVGSRQQAGQAPIWQDFPPACIQPFMRFTVISSEESRRP